jgi:hypothetical protein
LDRKETDRMITIRKTMGFAMLATALGAAWAAGCDDQKQVEAPPQPPADAGPPEAAPPPTVTAPPAPVAGPCDATQVAALTAMVQGRAAAEAPGMQPEGAATCNVVPEGQSASSQLFTIQQGFCYTILGASLPPVSELDMQLEMDPTSGAAVPPALAAIKPLLMTDTETGTNAAIGAKQNCYKWVLPIPAAVRVTLKSRTGSGPVAAQVFKKKSF